MRRAAVLCSLALVATAPATAGAAGLPKERYTPIGTALTAHAAFADGPTKELAELAAESCATMEDDGDFMKAYAKLCRARVEGDVAFAALDACKKDCRGVVKEIRSAVKDAMAAGKAFNGFTEKEVTDVRCRRALDVDGEEMRGLRALDAGLKDLSTGLRDRSKRKVRAAERRLAKVRGIPSAEQNLARLEKACAAEGSGNMAPAPPT